jgi:hypothetical protein
VVILDRFFFGPNTLFGHSSLRDIAERVPHTLPLPGSIAERTSSELHRIRVEVIGSMPEFVEEVRDETGTAARRFHRVIQALGGAVHYLVRLRRADDRRDVPAGNPIHLFIWLPHHRHVARYIAGTTFNAMQWT